MRGTVRKQLNKLAYKYRFATRRIGTSDLKKLWVEIPKPYRNMVYFELMLKERLEVTDGSSS
jgi:hypothetical protein